MLLSPVLSRCLECTPLRLLLLGGLLPPFLRRLMLGGLLGFIALLPLAAFAPVYAAQAGLDWQTVTTSLDHTWKSVAYGNGRFVAVAQDGVGNRVMTSLDGLTWTGQTSAADNSWTSVTYGNGLFVAVASSGTNNRVMTSPDGITWISRTSAANNIWNSVTFGNSLFVAVAQSGTGNRVMTSSDGSTWTSQTSPADNNWKSVTYGNGQFVAVASSGAKQVMTSPDGINWTTRTSAANNVWNSVTYGNGLFVAVAEGYGVGNLVMTSPDGIIWTVRTPAANNAWLSVTFGNGLFVAVAASGTGNRVMTSSNGINWILQTSAADNDWTSVTYANNLFVAVASGYGNGNRIMTSPDGATWTLRTYPPDQAWRSVTYGNSLFLAVGSGPVNRVMTSPDGSTWTSRISATNNDWRSVTYGNSLFVAVAISGTGNRVMTSSDGSTWTSRTSAADNDWRSVTYGNSLFVAVANSGTGNRVMTSSDGSTWTSQTSATNNDWNSVTYGNGLFVAVASSGTGNRVMTSPDGTTWTSRAAATDINWTSISYANNLFVAVAAATTGTGNRVMTSPDGITWTSRAAATDITWNSVIYANGLFVAVAYSGTGILGVMTSPDGSTWTSRTSAADNYWNSVTYGNNLFVAVASSGVGNRVMISTGSAAFTVIYNGNGSTGGTAPTDANSPYAQSATVTVLGNTGTLVKTGSTFAGWNTAANGSGTAQAAASSFTMGTSNVTLYAQWTANPTYTVTFNNNGGAGTMTAQTANAATNLTSNTFTRAGYTFGGWNTVAGGSGTAYADGASYAFAANVTLYAQWTANPTYTITFNNNGGAGTMTAQPANVATNLTSNTFTRAGYTFSGWNTVALGGGTAYADGASYAFAADVTLYAQWTALPTKTVTFNNNGGAGTMTAQTANVATALTTNTFTRAGYTFSGWNTVALGGGTAYTDGASYAFTADVTLYAQWTALIVTSNADPGLVGGCTSAPTTDCSLRDAIAAASTTVVDTITFNLAAGSKTITLGNELAIAKSVIIDGTTQAVTVSGNNAVRVFNISNGANFTLRNLTIANGRSTNAPGGGLYLATSNVTVTVDRCLLSSNSNSNMDGGAIYNTGGTLSVTDSQFTANHADFSGKDGGAIYGLVGTTIVQRSSFVSNSGDGGSAIRQSGGVLTVSNSTFSGNSSTTTSRNGGAIRSNGILKVYNSTFANNTNATGNNGALALQGGGTATLANILLSGNTPSNCYLGITPTGSNNLSTDASCTSGGFTQVTSALLGTVGDYGGTVTLPDGISHTQTFPLLPGSPAIDAGDAATCANAATVNNLDQRGIPRPQGTNCDIGAYESQGFTFTKTGDNQSATISTAFASPLAVTVTATGSGQVNGGIVTFTAPGTGASASAVLVGSPATIASGSASVTATANNTVGNYVVTAGAAGATAVDFSLTNNTPTPVNGACGSANGQTLTSAPTSGFCSVGTASSVSGNGPWTWSCAGSSGGGTALCSAGTGGGITGGNNTQFRLNSDVSPGCAVNSVNLISPPAGGPPGLTMPFGVVSFQLSGCTGGSATIQLTYTGAVAGMQYWKYINSGWLQMPGVTLAGTTATFIIEDNKPGNNKPYDADPREGYITDPSGPAIRAAAAAAAAAIPTLSEWALLLFGLLMGAVVSQRVLNRRR